MNTLPTKWCIKITSENEEILHKYWERIPGVDRTYSFYGWLISKHEDDDSFLNYAESKVLDGYTELTLAQFKKWVLKDGSDLVGKRFYHHTNKKEVYTITKVEEGTVHIKGDFGTTTYPLSQARQFFEHNTWILFESERRKESLLEKAKRLYPVGTKVKSLYHHGNPVLTIGDGIFKSAREDAIHVSSEEGVYMAVVYENGGWAEIITEEIRYYDNLSNHIGRYIQALVDYPNSGNVKKGDYGQIVSSGSANFLSSGAYACSRALSKKHLNISYKLMPEGFIPPTEEIKTTNMPIAQLTQQTISRSNLKAIHGRVCNKWQARIEEKLKENIFDEFISVPDDLLVEAFKEADRDQNEFLRKYFYQPVVSKEVNMKEWIEDLRVFRKSCRELIDVREDGMYEGKAFYLTSDFTWEIKADEYGVQCLIPTKN